MKTSTSKSIRPLVSLSLLCSLFLLSVVCKGQTYHFRQYTANDGLPTNAVYGGLQDQRGFVWFYTEHGVSRFDGYQFRNFTVEDGLPVNDVWFLAEDQQGRIWVNTFSNKLVAIEGDSVKTYYESTSPDFQRFEFITNGEDIAIYEKGTAHLLIPDSCCSVQQLPVPEEIKSIPDYLYYPCSRDTFIRFHEEDTKVSRVANEGFQENYLIGKEDTKIRTWLNHKYRQSCTYWNGRLLVWPFQDSLLGYLSLQSDSIGSFNLSQIFGSQPEFLRYQRLHGQLQIQTNLGLFIIDENMNGVDTLKERRFNNCPIWA
ncbi:MAG: two-component regulator propeller domain-containing protein [Phaeodactylibacter sp.]|uniref:two-component regulator propeller domain-containing protein n=1 Tax=Phaeodactylibacter sp. TaxID=1940289 RepID=UPI0032EBC824